MIINKNTMKKILLFFSFSVVVFTTPLLAQRYFGQWSTNFAGSYSPDSYGCCIGVEKVLGYSNSALRSELSFVNYDISINSLIPRQNIHTYSLQLGYVYCMEKYIPHAFGFNPSIGILSGIESFHGKLPQGVIRTRKNSFLFGCYLLMQAEIKLTPNLTLYIEPCGIFRFKSSQPENRDFTASLGFKYYIPR